ncbi:hypothetical protein WJX74_006647 [Apatococcus lobatus]|uniref:MutL C-terminal dimerisation domain-containing protein n=1 Tax=Apatococcus lobatus TaxID=904363 RepID=A0AAW1S076_9CHLO
MASEGAAASGVFASMSQGVRTQDAHDDDGDKLGGLGGVLQQWVNPAIPPPSAQPILDLKALGQTIPAAPISREDLQQARIVGQAANSFIAVACPEGRLVLVDQHAAHERVRLERLAAQVCPGGQAGCAPHVTSHMLDRPHVLHLGPQEAHIMEAHSERIRSWGWAWDVLTAMQVNSHISRPAQPSPLTCRQSSTASQIMKLPASGQCAADDAILSSSDDDSWPFAKAMLVGAPRMHRGPKRRRLANHDFKQTGSMAYSKQHVEKNVHSRVTASDSSFPMDSSCLGTIKAGDQGSIVLTHLACILGTTLNATELQIYLHQLSETSAASITPPGVTRTLASKACRHAIMFGDSLQPEQSEELVCSLLETSLWSICAHGRPTNAAVVNLQSLQGMTQAYLVAEVGQEAQSLFT